MFHRLATSKNIACLIIFVCVKQKMFLRSRHKFCYFCFSSNVFGRGQIVKHLLYRKLKYWSKSVWSFGQGMTKVDFAGFKFPIQHPKNALSWKRKIWRSWLRNDFSAKFAKFSNFGVRRVWRLRSPRFPRVVQKNELSISRKWNEKRPERTHPWSIDRN